MRRRAGNPPGQDGVTPAMAHGAVRRQPKWSARPRPAVTRGGRALLMALLVAAPSAPARTAEANPLPTVREDVSRIFSRESLGILLPGSALTAAGLAIEDPAATQRYLEQPAWDNQADAGNVYGDAAVLAAGSVALMTAGHFAHAPRLARTGSGLMRSLLYTSAIVLPLKLAVDRTRPNGGAYSFPSGHTAIAFSAAPVLASEFGLEAAIPAYALATATALGRMEDRKHYLSDVLFGATLGLVVGRAVTRPEHEGDAPRHRISLEPGPGELTVRF